MSDSFPGTPKADVICYGNSYFTSEYGATLGRYSLGPWGTVVAALQHALGPDYHVIPAGIPGGTWYDMIPHYADLVTSNIKSLPVIVVNHEIYNGISAPYPVADQLSQLNTVLSLEAGDSRIIGSVVCTQPLTPQPE